MMNAKTCGWIVCCVLAAWGAAFPVSAAEKVFTGAVDRYWSKSGNWQGGAVPVSGDSVILASTTQDHVHNDIDGLTLANLTFAGYGKSGSTLGSGGTAYNVYFEGKAFTLAPGGNIVQTSVVRMNQAVPIVLAAGAHEMAIAKNGRWDVTGAGTISGEGALTLASGLYIPYNDTTYAGGFTAKTGTEVYAFANRPFGNGPVLFENNARLTMYKTGISIPNDIEFQGEANNTGNFIINNSGAFTGTVTFHNQQRFKAASSANPLVLTFKGPVKSKNNSLLVTNLNVPDFRHELVFEDVADLGGRQLWMDGGGSTIRFRKAGNTFGSTRLSSGQVVFEVSGACCPTADLAMLGTAGSRIVVEGDQVARRLYRHSGTDTGFSVTSEKGGRLTLRDVQNDSFPGDLTGRLGLVWAPTGNFTFTAQGACTFSGALVVSNGTFAVGSALASPTNIASLVVVNAAKLQVPSGAAVRTRLDTLELASTATLSLPEQTDFVVDHFVLDGVEQPEKATYTGGAAADERVHLDALPANVTVTTRVQPGLGARVEWTGQGGASDRVDLGVNWADGAVPALHEKTLVAVTGGASASLVGDTTVNGFVFEKGPFTVKGAGALDLYWGGISVTEPLTDREMYTFDVPLRICGEQTWCVARGSTGKYGRLQLNAPVTDGDGLAHAIYKTDPGYLYLNATNTFSGDLVVSNGQVVVQTSESVGSPGSGKVVLVNSSGTAANIWLLPNRRISRPVELRGVDTYYVYSDQSGVCEFAGEVRIADAVNKRFRANGTSTMLFTGGVTGLGMFYMQGDGRYVITNKPVSVGNSVYTDVKADITFAVPSNDFSQVWLANAGSVLRIRTDDFMREKRAIQLRKGGRIDLGAHVVKIGQLVGAGAADTVDGRVTGEPGSELVVQVGGNTTHAVFEDAASLRYVGNGSNFSLCGLSSSTGTVSSANNCLIFTAGAGWTNGTVAVTNANAAILFNAGAQLGRKVDVTLAAGGRISLNPGVELVCRHLYLDGVRQTPGTYGSVASAAGTKSDTYFWTGNTGLLRVLGDQSGTMLIIR